MTSPVPVDDITGDGLPDDAAAKRVNAEFPGGTPGGMIETVKRAVVVALRDALTGTGLDDAVSGSTIHVDMEYPLTKEKYPGVWVQFSFTKITNAGVGQELISHMVEHPGTPDERVNWEPIREFIFEGRVSLTVVALTSIERDRISDAVVTMLMFSRPNEAVITDTTRDAKLFRQFISTLTANPYVSLAANLDMVAPGGQTTNVGVPWDPERLSYEDTYTFDLTGQSNIVIRHDGTYTLAALTQTPRAVDPYQWQ